MPTATASKKVNFVCGVHATLPDGTELSVTAQRYFVGVYAAWNENGHVIYQDTASSVKAWNRKIRKTVRQMQEDGLTVEVFTKKVTPCGEYEV